MSKYLVIAAHKKQVSVNIVFTMDVLCVKDHARHLGYKIDIVLAYFFSLIGKTNTFMVACIVIKVYKT